MRRLSLITVAAFLLFVPVAAGQQAASEAPVELNGKTLFVVHAGVGSFTTSERAKLVEERLERFLAVSPRKVETSIQRTDTGLLILVNGQAVISVTDEDVKAEHATEDVVAARWSDAIDAHLKYEEELKLHNTFWMRMLTLVVVVLATGLIIYLLGRAHGTAHKWLEARRERIPSLRLRGLELFSAEKLFRLQRRLVKGAYAAGLLVTVLAASLLVFAQFPQTQQYAQQVGVWILNPLLEILHGIVSYLPNLFFILVVVVVVRLVVRAVDFVTLQAERGVINLEPWLHRDVARPTGQICKAILIVLGLFFIAPLVPGTGSTAAKGLSVIIGLMVSFGSSSTVGNLIAGVVLTYMRPYQLGDRVRLGDTEGDVEERRFLYTKVVTIKNEEVIVPSLQALGNPIVNYSARARRTGLILHTTVTIGYDAPWRKVYELLNRAAERTEGILKEPQPFVMQTNLSDFFVVYELNAYTSRANDKAMIYSELHQNIQDSFNEGGIEILSPHYYQLRDGNHTAIPREYPGGNYRPRGFVMEPVTVQTKSPAGGEAEAK